MHELKTRINSELKSRVKTAADNNGVLMNQIYKECVELAAQKLRSGVELPVFGIKDKDCVFFVNKEDYKTIEEFAKKRGITRRAVLTYAIESFSNDILEAYEKTKTV